jgi:hypothetical protein
MQSLSNVVQEVARKISPETEKKNVHKDSAR